MDILLIVNPDKKSCGEAAKKVATELSSYPCRIFSDSEDCCRDCGIYSLDELSKKPDIAITIGGDGTILHSAGTLSKTDVPVLGINLGRFGYLAELEMSELPLLSQLFEGGLRLQERMLLDFTVIRDGEKVACMTALNDGVIGRSTRLVDLKLYCDEGEVTFYRADGLVISTPTGSTAYSLSAGGPVIAPGLKLIAVTPICAHSISARPIIFDAGSTLSVEIPSQRTTDIHLVVDGGGAYFLSAGDVVKICRSSRVLKTIKLKDNNFYQTLSAKFSGGNV